MIWELLNFEARDWNFAISVLLLIGGFLLIQLFATPREMLSRVSAALSEKAAVIYFSMLLFVYLQTVIGTFIQNYHKFNLQSDIASWGQVGDFFGGMLNPALSFASFIALLYTIRIQSEELKLTREEFAKSVAAQAKIAGETERSRSQILLLEDYRYASNLLRDEIGRLRSILKDDILLTRNATENGDSPPSSLSAVIGRLAIHIHKHKSDLTISQRFISGRIYLQRNLFSSDHQRTLLEEAVFNYCFTGTRLLSVLGMYLELCEKLEIDVSSQLVQKHDCKDAARHLAYCYCLAHIFDSISLPSTFIPHNSHLANGYFRDFLKSLGLDVLEQIV